MDCGDVWGVRNNDVYVAYCWWLLVHGNVLYTGAVIVYEYKYVGCKASRQVGQSEGWSVRMSARSSHRTIVAACSVSPTSPAYS